MVLTRKERIVLLDHRLPGVGLVSQFRSFVVMLRNLDISQVLNSG